MALGCSQSCQVLSTSEHSHRTLVPHRAQQCWESLGSLVLRDGPQLKCEQLSSVQRQVWNTVARKSLRPA